MHQIVSAPLDSSRRWWVLAIVVAAQFMFGVDAFIVNVAIPTIAVELHASAAQIEAVIAIYLIAYATLVVTGGRLGDIYGTKNVFLAGVLGFTVTSLWCGLAQSGPELIVGAAGARRDRGADGAAGARHAASAVCRRLARPRLRHLRHRARPCRRRRLSARRRAGDARISPGFGWRAVFFVNVPFGLSSSPRPCGSCRRCRAAPARGSIFPARSCCLRDCCA